MNIRKANINDADKILELVKSTSEVHASVKGGDEYGVNFVIESINNKENNVVFILEIDNQIGGVLIADIWIKKEYSFLIDLIIEEEFRGKGYGKIFLDHFENYCKELGIKSIEYFVLKDNFRMQEFSKKQGYVEGKELIYFGKDL